MEPCVNVTDARVLDGYRLELTFSNGRKGAVDLKDRVVGRGEMYQPLEDPKYFRQVRVDAELGTLVWPNGVDICPDLLYSLALGQPITEAAPSSAP